MTTQRAVVSTLAGIAVTTLAGIAVSTLAVIADLIRNPGCAWHWIPDRVRDDSRGRDDSRRRDDSRGLDGSRGPDDRTDRVHELPHFTRDGTDDGH